MWRLTILCLCVTLVWASPSPRKLAKVGLSQLKGPRIINGQEARPGEFPYQAAVFVTGTDGSGWFCGGSIVAEDWIITAGHCVDGAASAVVRTGSVNPTNGTASESSNIVLHPDYDASQLANDIGLIQLAEALTFDENTEPIQIDPQPVEEGAHMTVSGWGLTSDDATDISDVLNSIQLVTITNTECQDAYGSDVILDGMLCAQSDTPDVQSTCSGDSGGPGVVDRGGPEAGGPPQRSLAAIVSFVSDQGCEADVPSGYTRVSEHAEWIQTTITPASK